jgi:hypothetical protein
MTRFSRTLAVAALAATAIVARPAAQTASIKNDFLQDWQGQKDTLVKIAQAMPEDKYSFKATPAQRSFGEHVLHIAMVNMMVLQTLGAKAPAPQVDLKATSKADRIKAMSDTFDYGLAILREQTDQTMVGGVQGPP